MVEEDAVTGVHAIGFTVVHGDPVGVHLGDRIRAARVKRRGFLLRGFPAPDHTARRWRLDRSLVFFSRPRKRIASSRRRVPMASTSAVYSGASKLTATCDWAPRL